MHEHIHSVHTYIQMHSLFGTFRWIYTVSAASYSNYKQWERVNHHIFQRIYQE